MNRKRKENSKVKEVNKDTKVGKMEIKSEKMKIKIN